MMLWWFAMFLLMVSAPLWAARSEEAVLPDADHTPGTYTAGPFAVPAGATKVGMALNRAQFQNPKSEVWFKIEAFHDGAWREIKRTGKTPGGIRTIGGKPQQHSASYTTLPAGTSQVRASVTIEGSNAHIPVTLFFE